jgi:CDGSH-type Zn-finger protein
MTKARVTVTANGPYLVSGAVPLASQTIGADEEGGSQVWIEGEALAVRENYRLCRCGQSHTKPFCDGTHAQIGFDGAETASREAYLDQAREFIGPAHVLTDVESLCAFARFCDTNGKVWNQVRRSDAPDVAETFTRQVGNCPAGRLVAWVKATQTVLEPKLATSIGLVEDPVQNCSGPLWLRGEIDVVAADGTAYELRNRVALCRCGQSSNKPFCDGTHAAVGFRSDAS